MAKKKSDAPKVNKPEFIYTVDEVYNSGTSTNVNFTSNTCDTNWVITDTPKTIGEEMKKTGKAFTYFDEKFKGAIKKSKVKFCQTCGNMYEEGLDDNFCSAECKYKYCEIEDEADKHSE